MTRPVNLAEGEFYHIYNRGTEGRDIFMSVSDYDRFLALLYICNSTLPVDLKLQGRTLYELGDVGKKTSLVTICSYCLMPNHFHLLLYENQEGGISKFMQKIMTAYTMYFNKKSDRSGALFQGKFKAKHIIDDNYLQYIISYIHLNPVKIIEPKWRELGIKDLLKTKKFIEEYKYSSYPEFTRKNRIESKIINVDTLPNYFENSFEFKSTVNFWLNYNIST